MKFNQTRGIARSLTAIGWRRAWPRVFFLVWPLCTIGGCAFDYPDLRVMPRWSRAFLDWEPGSEEDSLVRLYAWAVVGWAVVLLPLAHGNLRRIGNAVGSVVRSILEDESMREAARIVAHPVATTRDARRFGPWWTAMLTWPLAIASVAFVVYVGSYLARVWLASFVLPILAIGIGAGWVWSVGWMFSVARRKDAVAADPALVSRADSPATRASVEDRPASNRLEDIEPLPGMLPPYT